jgi:putative transposase
MDANHHGLADNVYGRVELYQACLKQGASVHEMEFLRKSWARNQLTGNDHFIDEIEISLGRRVERRAGGRPAREKCGK